MNDRFVDVDCIPGNHWNNGCSECLCTGWLNVLFFKKIFVSSIVNFQMKDEKSVQKVHVKVVHQNIE